MLLINKHVVLRSFTLIYFLTLTSGFHTLNFITEIVNNFMKMFY